MKRKIHTYLPALVAALLLLLAVGAGSAMVQQSDGFKKVTIPVKIQQGISTTEFRYETVRYALFRSIQKANDAKNKIQAAIEAGKKSNVDPAMAFSDAVNSLGLNLIQSDPTGTIVLNAMSGSGLLIVGDEGDETPKITTVQVPQGGGTAIKINDVVLKSDVVTIGTVYKNAKRKRRTVPRKPKDFGPEAKFNLHIDKFAGEVNGDTRIILQPIIIDCLTEDTIEYLKPLVFEGERFHKLQHRRMAFDYFKNDSLARGYMPAYVPRDNEPFYFDTTVVYKKPVPKNTYRCPYIVSVEDYLHLMSDSSDVHPGSCNPLRPFKLFDFSVATTDLRLTSEFHENAESNFDNYSQDIQLKFVQGKDELTTDSINELTLSNFSKELRTYGDKLWNLSVEGCSSPEGSVERNTLLARQRAAKASSLLRGVPGDVHRQILPPHVYTWEDVLEEVKKQNNQEITDMVQNVVANHKANEVYGLMKSLPFFETVIGPILQKQRVIRFKYMVQRERIMEADEAVDFYYRHKQELLKGEKRLSDGDYYNLFATVRDSAELDTITMLSYKQIASKAAYERLKLAPYVANRMALLKIRQGHADVNILRPFIDLDDQQVNHVIRVDNYNNTRMVNREELLTNQAVAYFQEEKTDTASFIVDSYLKGSPAAEKLSMYVLIKDYFDSYISNSIDDQQTYEAVDRAVKEVIDTSDENKAIVKTEYYDDLKVKLYEVEPLIMKLSDDNPKKWYMLGEVWSKEAGREETVKTTIVDNVDEDNTVPYHLAFFQHSFDLKPEYKRFYLTEGNVPDNVRKQFPYRKKDIGLYRQKFLQIKEQMDKKLKEGNNAVLPGDSEAGANADGTSGTNADGTSGNNADGTSGNNADANVGGNLQEQ